MLGKGVHRERIPDELRSPKIGPLHQSQINPAW
jgi:hypothetical protein